ncbi:MAG: hypothetical protein WC981_04305 [Candidatus Dojkabacteria bacterium]
MTTTKTKRSTSKTIRTSYILKQLEKLIETRFKDVEVIVKRYLNDNGTYFNGDEVNYLSMYVPDSFLNEGEVKLLRSINKFTREQAGNLISNIVVEQQKLITSYNLTKANNNSLRFENALNAMPGTVPDSIHQPGMTRPMPVHEVPMDTYQNPNGFYNNSGYTPYPHHSRPPGYINTPVAIKPMGEQFQGIYPQSHTSENQKTYTGLNTGCTNENNQHDNHRTNNAFKIEPTMQQGLKFTNTYEILYKALNLPADEKQVLKHMVDYVIENDNSTDEKVRKLVEAYKKTIDAICDMC